VGVKVARDLARHFRSLEALRSADQKQLQAVDAVGPKMAAAGGPLKGTKFVFTGSLDTLTRDQAGELVESLGGEAASSVSGETDYVVVGEAPGQKADEAGEKGVRTLKEKAFLKLLRKNGAALQSD